jgi:hypothetical protein
VSPSPSQKNLEKDASLGDSLDFENSDELNSIISKYESMLDKPKAPASLQAHKSKELVFQDVMDEEDWSPPVH